MTQRNRQLESTCSMHAWKDRVSHSERGGVMWFRRKVSQSAELGIWSSLSQLSADREAKETYIAAAQISEASHTAAAAGTVCHSQHGGTTPPEPGVPPSVVTPKGHTVEDTVTSLSTLVISTAFTSVAAYLTPVSVTQDVCA